MHACTVTTAGARAREGFRAERIGPRDHPRELRRVAGLRYLLFSMQFEPQGGVLVHRCSVNVCASDPVGKIACAKYTINSANEIESIAGRDVW